MSEYIIEMSHITKTFPGIVANDDISLCIKKGEIFALLGENGAGKSTLMSMLFGMYEPDAGEIRIRGRAEKIHSPGYAAGLNIGMVHQHFKLVHTYTVAENIILGIPKKDKLFHFLPFVDIKKANREIAALSERYGLRVNPTDIVGNLNVSTRQRVEILKMLYREAEILIFDEPTAVLTPQEISFLLEIIRNLRDGGKTIILITHKLEEIKQIADRCAILNRGRLVDILQVSQVTTRHMANLMVGREVSFKAEKKKAAFGEKVLTLEGVHLENSAGFSILSDISFSIRRGEILAIAGVSGNGQVELADTICGLQKPTKGRILLKGTDITRASVRERCLAGISYIPEDRQRYGLVLDFTLEENLLLKQYFKEPFSKNNIFQPAAMERYAGELIEKYDIRSARGGDTIVRSMSGGNQQKAIIGREIALSSDLMVFVQPTRGLDIGAIEQIHTRILREREKGRAILLISLELDEVMALADTVAVIYNGRILTIEDAGALTTNRVGEYMMGVTG